jgi:sterol desaturase/sphingolipid hydroxylase (fatty acid hydroxylase superfamily)
MKKNIFSVALMLLVLSMSLTSCEVVGDLVEFGVWIGVVIVVAVLAIIFWIYRKFKK